MKIDKLGDDFLDFATKKIERDLKKVKVYESALQRIRNVMLNDDLEDSSMRIAFVMGAADAALTMFGVKDED